MLIKWVVWKTKKCLTAPPECNIPHWRTAYLGSIEFGGLDFAGDVTLDSCPEFTEDPDRESCAGVGWLW